MRGDLNATQRRSQVVELFVRAALRRCVALHYIALQLRADPLREDINYLGEGSEAQLHWRMIEFQRFNVLMSTHSESWLTMRCKKLAQDMF